MCASIYVTASTPLSPERQLNYTIALHFIATAAEITMHKTYVTLRITHSYVRFVITLVCRNSAQLSINLIAAAVDH